MARNFGDIGALYPSAAQGSVAGIQNMQNILGVNDALNKRYADAETLRQMQFAAPNAPSELQPFTLAGLTVPDSQIKNGFIPAKGEIAPREVIPEVAAAPAAAPAAAAPAPKSVVFKDATQQAGVVTKPTIPTYDSAASGRAGYVQAEGVPLVDPNAAGWSKMQQEAGARQAVIQQRENIALDLALGRRKDIPAGSPLGSIYGYFADDKKTAELRDRASKASDWYRNDESLKYFMQNPQALAAAKKDPLGFYDAFQNEIKIPAGLKMPAGKTGQLPVDPTVLFSAMQYAESRGDAGAVSPKGATGLMQVMPSTALKPGYGIPNIFDFAKSQGMTVEMPRNEASAAVLLKNAGLNQAYGQAIMGAMLNRYQDTDRALVAYNWGPGNADKWIAAGADPKKLPKETQGYLATIHQKMGDGQPAVADASGFTRLDPNDPRAVALRKAHEERLGTAIDSAALYRQPGQITPTTGAFAVAAPAADAAHPVVAAADTTRKMVLGPDLSKNPPSVAQFDMDTKNLITERDFITTQAKAMENSVKQGLQNELARVQIDHQNASAEYNFVKSQYDAAMRTGNRPLMMELQPKLNNAAAKINTLQVSYNNAAKSAQDQITQLNQQLYGAMKNNETALWAANARMAFSELESTGDPRRMQAVWSEFSGGNKIDIQQRTDGKWNLSINGVKTPTPLDTNALVGKFRGTVEGPIRALQEQTAAARASFLYEKLTESAIKQQEKLSEQLGEAQIKIIEGKLAYKKDLDGFQKPVVMENGKAIVFPKDASTGMAFIIDVSPESFGEDGILKPSVIQPVRLGVQAAPQTAKK